MQKDPDIQAELYQNLGSIYRKLGELARAEEMFQEAMQRRLRSTGARSAAVEMSRNVLPTGHAASAAATEALGRVLEEKGDYARAIPPRNAMTTPCRSCATRLPFRSACSAPCTRESRRR